MRDHANIMIWALFSQLESGGEASCTLSGDNKQPIVCVSEYVIVCVCVCVFVMVEVDGRGQP